MKANKITAYDVACYLSKLNDIYEDYGDVMTNLKLQKLVYYVQGFHLAIFNKPMFEDDIQAWKYGPVVPSLYNKLKCFKNREVKIEPNRENGKLFNKEQSALMDKVFEQLGQFSAWKLMNMTHQESPWAETNLLDVISHDKMSAFFKNKLA